MTKRLFLSFVGAILGLWLASNLSPQVSLSGDYTDYIIIGGAVAFVNMFIKPILNIFTLPVRILTLGLSSLIINLGLLALVDLAFPQLKIEGIIGLFVATLAISITSMLLYTLVKND